VISVASTPDNGRVKRFKEGVIMLQIEKYYQLLEGKKRKFRDWNVQPYVNLGQGYGAWTSSV
jgi:hypothetical protein